MHGWMDGNLICTICILYPFRDGADFSSTSVLCVFGKIKCKLPEYFCSKLLVFVLLTSIHSNVIVFLMCISSEDLYSKYNNSNWFKFMSYRHALQTCIYGIQQMPFHCKSF